MYNRSQKMAYIEATKQAETALLFNKTKQYEEILKKDLCNFTKDEILKWLVSCNTAIASLETYVSRAKSYTTWCCENNLSIDGLNHFHEVSRSDVKLCSNMLINEAKFKTREEVLEYCELVDDPVDAVIILGSFEGLWGIDRGFTLGSLTYYDVNYINKTVNAGGRIYSMPDEFINYVEKAKSSYTEEKTGYLSLIEDDHIVKARVNSKDPWGKVSVESRVRKRLMKVSDRLGAPITGKSLDQSGFLYTMSEKIKELGVDENKFLVEGDYKNIMERYNRKTLNTTKTKELLERYLS